MKNLILNFICIIVVLICSSISNGSICDDEIAVDTVLPGYPPAAPSHLSRFATDSLKYDTIDYSIYQKNSWQKVDGGGEEIFPVH